MQDLVMLVDKGMERAIREGCVDQDECDAWQDLKAAVLAQQPNNTASTPLCDGCNSRFRSSVRRMTPYILRDVR